VSNDLESKEALLRLVQAERERRRAEKRAAGDVIVLRVPVENDEDVEAKKAEALKQHLLWNPGDKGKDIEWVVRRFVPGLVPTDEGGKPLTFDELMEPDCMGIAPDWALSEWIALAREALGMEPEPVEDPWKPSPVSHLLPHPSQAAMPPETSPKNDG